MISFVIPVFNEQDSLATLAEAIRNACQDNIEIVFVDDGSTDQTWSVIENLAQSPSEVHGLRLNRNFGKAAALAAGFHRAKGDLIFTLDGDLQDDPSNIPAFLAKMAEGKFDLISGWRRRREDTRFKRIASKVFNRLVSFTTGVKLQDHNCGFKLYRRPVIDAIQLYGELHRFVPVLASAKGFQVGEIAVVHQPRKFGRSKYGLWRYICSFFDLFTVLLINRFQYRPSHFLGLIGAMAFCAGFLALGYLAAIWFSGVRIGHRPLLIYALGALIVGCQFMVGGILAELLTASLADRRLPYLISGRTEFAETQPKRAI